MLCPICHNPLKSDLNCEHGHQFEKVNGIPALLKPEFKSKLDIFTRQLAEVRQQMGHRLIQKHLFDQLPYASDLPQAELWPAKQKDLEYLERFIKNKDPMRILDVGAWNGWMSNRLSMAGHQVWAIDYLNDEYDGLGAYSHYSNPKWQPYQVDLNDLSVFNDERFDLIIVNRCSVFFTDPLSSYRHLRKLLSSKGSLLITDLQFFKDKAKEHQRQKLQRQEFRDKNGFDMFIFPIKGCLNMDDFREMKREGYRLRPFPKPLRNIVKRYAIPGATLHYLAEYTNSK